MGWDARMINMPIALDVLSAYMRDRNRLLGQEGVAAAGYSDSQEQQAMEASRLNQDRVVDQLSQLMALNKQDQQGVMAREKKPLAKVQDMETLDDMPSNLTFGSAFKLARQRGLMEFFWRGKKYTTKVKK